MGLAGKMDARRLPFYYGWVVFAVTFLIYAFMYGLRYSIGVFFTPIQQEFGWTTATTASAVTVFFWVYALAAPIVGGLAARIGVRKTVFIGGLLLGGGGALVSQVQALWQLYLFWGVIAAFGSAALYVIPTMALSRFFLKKRGRAVGWASVGVSVGQAILVPLVGLAIQSYGWRAAILGMGSIVVVVTSVVGYMFLREDPESMGLHVDGEEPDDPVESSEPVAVEPEEYLEPREVLATSTFRLVILSYFFAVGGIISILTFVVPHMIRMGINPTQASGAFGVIGVMSAAGSFLFGFVSDRLGRKTTILATTIGIGVSFFVASIIPPDMTLLYAWAVLYGFTYGGCPEQYAALISDYYGNRHATTLFGFLTLGGGIGGGLFPLIGGWLVDLTGTYFWTLILLGFSMVAAALMIFAASPPRA